MVMMMNNTPFFEEEYQGFTIRVYAEEEDLPLEDTFDDSIDDIKHLYRKIITGDLVYFCAHVSASKCGVVLGDDYLGACLYDSLESFVAEDGYYPDMSYEVVRQATKTIKELCRGMNHE